MTSDLGVAGYLSRVSQAIESIDEQKVLEFVDLMCGLRRRDCKVLVCGNGGSSTTASHMATDLGVGSQKVGCGIRIISLSDNMAAVTAIGNDVSFVEVFAAQVQLLGSDGDMLIAISASGNSPNVIEAALRARDQGMTVVGITGFSGGRLKGLADISVHVTTADGDYGVAEDAHMIINHIVTELVRIKLGDASDGLNLHD